MLGVARHLTMERNEVSASKLKQLKGKCLALPKLKQGLHQRSDFNNLVSV